MELGVPLLFLGMFLRKKKNTSGSISIQIISKAKGKYSVISSIGSAFDEQGIKKLWNLGKQEIERLSSQSKLFDSENDLIIDQIFETLNNSNIRTIGPEIIFGKIYDYLGFNA